MAEELSEQLGEDWRVHCDCRAKLKVAPGRERVFLDSLSGLRQGTTCLRQKSSLPISRHFGDYKVVEAEHDLNTDRTV